MAEDVAHILLLLLSIFYVYVNFDTVACYISFGPNE